MITALLFIFVLSVLVFVHEAGHFIVAKLSGMRVDEFGLGFPPRVLSWKRGETRYSINLLPFGGFVKIFGENPNEESMTGEDSSRSFTSRPRYWQVAVLVAGVTCNVLFAWALTSAGFMHGLPVSAQSYNTRVEDVNVVITQVVAESPAALAGLKEGDEVQLLETQNDAVYPRTTEEVTTFIHAHGGEEITFHYKRGEVSNSAVVVPTVGVAGAASDQPVIGVGLDSIGILKLPFFSALIEGAKATYYSVINTAVGIFSFIGNAFTEDHAFKDVSGPIGIAKLVGSARALGLPYLISFVSFISINLAVINMLPFPALDGGRVLFVLIESVIRRQIPVKFTNMVNATGFILLLLLMGVVTYNDILKLFVK